MKTQMTAALAGVIFIIAMGLQSTTSAEEKKFTPAAKPTPPARVAPAVRPVTPPPRTAPIARPVTPPQQSPVVRAPLSPRVVTPSTSPSAPAVTTQRSPARLILGPLAGPTHATTMRGASRTVLSGQNFSVWRGGGRYRAYRGGHWRTFVSLSALSPIFVGLAYYYPYAYIDAPYDYCQGGTDDGCELMWQEVPTDEGIAEYQCVAYCPWQ